MKQHFCPAEQSMIAFEKECNWCGEKESLAQTQEPDYWLGYGLQAHTEKPFESATPLYIHPPQRTWVGLTDEDCKGMGAGDKVVAMWADRTLKEKNT